MKAPLRLKFFYWVLALLGLFIVLQTIVYGLIELYGWFQRPEERLSQQLMEVVVGVSWNLVLLPVLMGLAWWMSRRMIDPIRAIVLSARNILKGQFESRIQTDSMPDDEMRHLALTLNAAFDNYHDAVERLRRFSGNASHQLRTPLATVRSVGEVALSRDRTPDEYRTAIAQILDETSRLTTVIEQLLRLARLDRQDVRSAFQPVDLEPIVRRVADTFLPLCQEKSIVLRMDIETGARVAGNTELLMEMLVNLMDNATRCTPAGGDILIRLEKPAADRVRITVADTGPGISAERAKRIFERFSTFPSDSSSGSGLGLAIVSEIARVHDGRVELLASPVPGAVFAVTLPVLNPSIPGSKPALV
jgi:signal transduction histidine kinase